MGRVTSAAAVLPALLPGACVAFLGFHAGGFYPESWSVVAFACAVGLALRVASVERPFAGLNAWSAVVAGALALLGAWTLLSATWSGAAGRATVEFGRLLMYLLVFVVCATMAQRETRLAWGIRGVVAAIAAICVVALITRLRPDVLSEPALGGGRLDFPITYWNGLGVLAGVGAVLAFHLSASEHEPWPVRILAAPLVPIAACTLYFTLSRGGIAAAGIGAVAYLLLGFSRAAPGALIAIVPAGVVAVRKAYDAEALVSSDWAAATSQADGVVHTLVLACLVTLGLRAVLVGLDLALRRVPGPSRLPRGVRWGTVAGCAAVVVVVALALGAPGYVHRQADMFLSSSPGPAPSDVRQRLTQFNNNGRVGHWRIALDAFRANPLHGNGAGTFQILWNQHRRAPSQVLDAHSLYIEVLGEMGLVGEVLLVTMLVALLAGLAWRLRGDRRPAAAAVLAATLAWAVHAGVDWDWELGAVTVWVFGLGGLALAGDGPGWAPPRLARLLMALACLLIALSPAMLWRSQTKLQDALHAFERRDCPATVDAALDSLSALSVRPEPWELIAYCDARAGESALAQDAAKAAIRRDPDNWEFHYALALVRAVAREDPRPEAAAALRLNPLQPETQRAVKAFRTGSKAAWERRARRLPIDLR
jgi:hypothetical protein